MDDILGVEKLIRRNIGLLEDGAKGSLGHVAWMVGDGGEPTCDGVPPNFVAAGGMAAEGEAKFFEFFDDLPVQYPESRPTSDHHRQVE